MTDTLSRIRAKYSLAPDARSPITLPIYREGLAALFAELGFNVGAEIGVQKGLYSATLCQANPSLHLYCVDAWRAYDGYLDELKQRNFDKHHAEALERLAPYNCTILNDWSTEAARQVEDGSLDFVYIDAAHDLRHVIDDIEDWSAKVRPGGIISGHDYVPRRRVIRCQVKQAVDCWVYTFRLEPLFLITGGDNPKAGPPGNAFASWFWVKPESTTPG